MAPRTRVDRDLATDSDSASSPSEALTSALRPDPGSAPVSSALLDPAAAASPPALDSVDDILHRLNGGASPRAAASPAAALNATDAPRADPSAQERQPTPVANDSGSAAAAGVATDSGAAGAAGVATDSGAAGAAGVATDSGAAAAPGSAGGAAGPTVTPAAGGGASSAPSAGAASALPASLTAAAGSAAPASASASITAAPADPVVASAPAASTTGGANLATGDLALIDEELAEHQRWAGAQATVGAAGSSDRAAFVAGAVGSGLLGSFAQGAADGLKIGLVSQAAEFVGIPGVGAVIGGYQSLEALSAENLDRASQVVNSFGQGNDTYEVLANSIAAVAQIVDTTVNVMNVITGIVGVIEIACWAIAGVGVIVTILTAGAGAAIVAMAAEAAEVLEDVREGLGEVSFILAKVNGFILQPCVALFRSLHAFTSDADPSQVEAQGSQISAAAGAAGGLLGGMAGGKLAEGMTKEPQPEPELPNPKGSVPAEETLPATEPPQVAFEEPPAAVPEAENATPPAADAHPAPADSNAAAHPAETNSAPEQLVIPGLEGALAAPPSPQQPNAYEPRGPQVEPDIVLPIEYPSAAVGPTDEGFATRHRLQEPRGSTQISEHVIPGAQWETISPPSPGDPTRPVYESQTGRHYQNDTTVRVPTEVADFKTHEGAQSDNRRTQGIKDQAAAGGGVNVIDDLYLPSIQQTRDAINASPGAQVTEGQAVFGATMQLQHQFDVGAGQVNYRSEATGQSIANEYRAQLSAANGDPAKVQAAHEWLDSQSPRLRDRGAELGQVGDLAGTLDPHGVASFDEAGWDATFGLQPTGPGAQLGLPGIENPAPRPASTTPEQTWLPGMNPAHMSDPGQLSLDFSGTRPAPAENSAQSPPPASPATAQSAPPTAPAAASADPGRAAIRDAQTTSRPHVHGAPQAPAAGVETVNPNYPAPPGTPQQVKQMQAEIENLLAARAQAEQAENQMAAQEQQHQQNQEHAQKAVQTTTQSISASAAHQQALARRKQANEQQQKRQQDSQGLVAGYPSQATGMAALTGPLMVFQGFTSLASHLPGSAGDSMQKMSSDADRMLAAFGEMGTTMETQNSAQPARQEELQGDQQRLESTDQQAQSSDTQLQSAKEGAQAFQQTNETRLQEATQARTEANEQKQELDDAATAKQTEAQTLAAQMDEWAAGHKAARAAAIEETKQRLIAEGKIVSGTSKET